MPNSPSFHKVFKTENLKQSFGFLALIDPDLKNDAILEQMIECVNNNNFSSILVGGSSMLDQKYDDRIKLIKDISAGAVSFAVISSLIVLIIIYYPYISACLK